MKAVIGVKKADRHPFILPLLSFALSLQKRNGTRHITNNGKRVDMYKILFLTREEGKVDLRQTPNGSGITRDGKCRYYTNEIIPDPDFVVVRGKGFYKDLNLHVAPQNIMLVTSEPYSILSYPKGYCKQFGLVCSCQKNLRMPNVIYTPAILPWYVGVDYDNNCCQTLSMEEIEKAQPKKTKLISVISSTKSFSQGHIDRILFVKKLKKHFGENNVDVFGDGHRPFGDKWDVLAPYKYHITIENSSSPYYWTEKLSDAFLAGAYPIYHGCTNIEDYFPKDALTKIDIRKPEKAIEIIDKVIATDTYEKSKDALAESKELALHKYNMYEYMAELCLKHLDPSAPKKDITLHPARSFFDLHNLYLHLIGRSYYRLKMKIMNKFQ